MSTFFALLTVAANLAVIGWLVLWIAARFSTAAGDRLDEVVESLRGPAVTLAWIVALVATLGSLYYSEIADLFPCRLCWFQRIAMYPLSVILLVGALRREATVRFYAYPLAMIGFAIAGYHRVVQLYPSLETKACAASGVGCAGSLVKQFGYVTIPWMALSAFALIIVLLWAAGIAARRSDEDQEPGVRSALVE